MKAFAILLDRLSYMPSRLGKLELLKNYFKSTQDPDRGYALAALSDAIPVKVPLRRIITELSKDKFDPYLFGLSRDYVGDSAETLALIWPPSETNQTPPFLHEIIESLKLLKAAEIAPVIGKWLDQCNSVERWALLKFLSGASRVGVSARLAKTALADAFGADIHDIEEMWHGVLPPYLSLFAWLEGKGDKPISTGVPVFKPLMLSNPLEDQVRDSIDISEFAVEWKWDGIRVQFSRTGGVTKLFSRSGDDISATFPELVADQNFEGILDGELLVMQNNSVAPFADLQQRLNRKSVTATMLKKFPAHIRLYDALQLDGEDLRELIFDDRRKYLEGWFEKHQSHHTDLSPLLKIKDKSELLDLWSNIREEGIEGLMLKRRTSAYLQGRQQGHWYKWKRSPLVADCVLLYAQRGAGKRSSFYSDYTFGAWKDENGARVLVPVGKAYSGFTDEELRRIDRFIRENTLQKFGPVRSVKAELVFEVAFDAINLSGRHKSGVAMRFPRISRIRWDKPAAEADTLETLMKLVEGRKVDSQN
jgi:DNA ligase 1